MKSIIPFVAVVGVGGCGGSPGETPDAAVDPVLTCTPGGPPGPITIDGPTTSPGAMVTFLLHDASGAVTTRSSVMGSDATFTGDVAPCGFASAVVSDPMGNPKLEVTSWAAVKPGDHLGSLARKPATISRAVHVDVNTLGGATGYQVVVVCPRSGIALTFQPAAGGVDLSPSCPTDATTISAAVIAKFPGGHAVALARDVTLAASGVTNVAMPVYLTAQSITATLHGLSGLANGKAQVATFTIPSPDRPVVLGTAIGTITGGDATTAPAPALSGPGVIEIDLFSANGAMPQVTHLLRRGVATVPASVSIDASELLPIASGTVDADPLRPTVTWMTDRAPNADFVAIELTRGTARWGIIAPPVPGTIQFPEMPVDLLPAGPSTIHELNFFESSAFASYDDVRANLGVLLDPPTVDGELRLTSARFTP